MAPKAIFPKLLQAKQAADLHSPIFNQRMVAEVMKDGFLDRHVPTIRALYKRQRDAMLAALTTRDEGAGRRVQQARRRHVPVAAAAGRAVGAVELLPLAVERGVAFVPGAPFYAGAADPRTLRLSFVTASVDEIGTAIAALAGAVREALAGDAGSRAAARADVAPEPAAG